jgi:hypothetical protein
VAALKDLHGERHEIRTRKTEILERIAVPFFELLNLDVQQIVLIQQFPKVSGIHENQSIGFGNGLKVGEDLALHADYVAKPYGTSMSFFG